MKDLTTNQQPAIIEASNKHLAFVQRIGQHSSKVFIGVRFPYAGPKTKVLQHKNLTINQIGAIIHTWVEEVLGNRDTQKNLTINGKGVIIDT